MYRGHRGREAWEVAFELRRVEEMAKPLFAREKELVQEKQRLVDEAKELLEALEVCRPLKRRGQRKAKRHG